MNFSLVISALVLSGFLTSVCLAFPSKSDIVSAPAVNCREALLSPIAVDLEYAVPVIGAWIEKHVPKEERTAPKRLLAREPLKFLQTVFFDFSNHEIRIFVRQYGLDGGGGRSPGQIRQELKETDDRLAVKDEAISGDAKMIAALNQISNLDRATLTPIRKLNLPRTAELLLRNDGIDSVETLLEFTDLDLQGIPKFNARILGEVRSAIDAAGINLPSAFSLADLKQIAAADLKSVPIGRLPLKAEFIIILRKGGAKRFADLKTVNPLKIDPILSRRAQIVAAMGELHQELGIDARDPSALPDLEDVRPEQLLDLPVTILKVKPRVLTGLGKLGIVTVQQLLERPRDTLILQSFIGAGSLEEIDKQLEPFGFKLRDPE